MPIILYSNIMMLKTSRFLALFILLHGHLVNLCESRLFVPFTVSDNFRWYSPYMTFLDLMVIDEPNCLMLIDLDNTEESIGDVFFLRYRQKPNISFITSTYLDEQNDKLSNALLCMQPNKYIFVVDYVGPNFINALRNIPIGYHDGIVLVMSKTRSMEENLIKMFKSFTEIASYCVFVVQDFQGGRGGGGGTLIESNHGFLEYTQLNDNTDTTEVAKRIHMIRDQFPSGSTIRVVMKSISPSAFFPGITDQPPEYNGTVKGVEAILINTVLRYTGASPLYIRPPLDSEMGLRLPGGNFSGSLGMVVQGDASVAGNPRVITYQWMDELDFSYPHAKDNYCILVQKAKQVPLYLTLLLPFTSQVWLLIIGAIMVLVAAKQVIKRSVSGWVDSIFRIVRLFITGSYQLETDRASNRIFLSICLIYTIIILNSFQGSLYSFLASPIYLDDIHTLRQIWEQVHTVYTYQPYMNMFTSLDDDDIMGKLSKRLKPVLHIKDLADACDKVAGSPYYGFLLPDIVTTHVRYTYIEDGKFLMHLVEECALTPAYIGYPVRRNWPGLPRLELLIQRLVEGGFVAKWHKDSEYDSFVAGTFKQPTTKIRPRPMTVEHLQGAFMVLLGGLICSCIIFAAEYSLSIASRMYKKGYIRKLQRF